MSREQKKLAELVERDPRYAYEAYEFVFRAITHTQKMLDRIPREGETDPGPQYHVTGRELLQGIRELALLEFGRMARIVFKLWGINNTSDFGQIVFNLVAEQLMSKTDHDSLDDFRDVYDLDAALVDGFRLELDEPEWMR